MRRVGTLLAIAAIASALSATTAAARIDPCLLTPEEIEDVVGIEVAQEFMGVAECSYVSEGNHDEGASVAVALLEAESKKDAKLFFKEEKAFATDAERVEGVGSAAFYSGGLGDMVMFRKGSTVVSVTLLVFAEELEPHRDDVVALAEVAADNL